MRAARVAPLVGLLLVASCALARPAEAQRWPATAFDWSAPPTAATAADVTPPGTHERDTATLRELRLAALSPRAVHAPGGEMALGDDDAARWTRRQTREAQRRRARWAPVASAALPGTGQALLDQQRFLPYLAVEGFAWLQIIADRHDGRRHRRAYRDIARTVARAQFSSSTPTGDWEYYERMEHFTESGIYDLNPGGELDPEADTTTYNGSVWLLARQTYWEDAGVPPPTASTAYASAIAFYRQRAVTSDYRWSWKNAELEQDVFRRTIARSNDAYRRAAQDLAVVIANHVLSTVDAYVTVRLRNRRVGAGGRLPTTGRGDGYGVSVELPLARSASGRR